MVTFRQRLTHIQVNPDCYLCHGYDSKGRFMSYWHQIDEIRSLSPASVLEIGVGNGFVSNYLRDRGVNVITLDIDNRLRPMVVGDVLQLPFRSETFEAVACYEGLEHLPYSSFLPALTELLRVAQRNVLLSLPDATRFFRIQVPVPWLGKLGIMLPVLRRKCPLEHKFDGEHHWEIGKDGYSLRSVVEQIASVCQISNSYRVFEFPYHRFFFWRKTE